MTRASAPIWAGEIRQTNTTTSPSQSTPSLSGLSPVTALDPSLTTMDDFEKLLDGEPKVCPLCQNHPKVVELLDRWLARRLDKTTKASLKSVLKFARLRYKYPHTTTNPFRDHLLRCRPADYEKAQLGG